MALSINNIELEGRVYKYEVRKTSTDKTIYSFSLMFWNGKNKKGESLYAFINCKCFDDFKLKEKQNIVVKGYYANNSWVDKEGKTHERPEIIVREIEQKNFSSNDREKESSFINDEIPF